MPTPVVPVAVGLGGGVTAIPGRQNPPLRQRLFQKTSETFPTGEKTWGLLVFRAAGVRLAALAQLRNPAAQFSEEVPGNKVGIVRWGSAGYNGATVRCLPGWGGIEVPLQPRRALILELAFQRSCYPWQRL